MSARGDVPCAADRVCWNREWKMERNPISRPQWWLISWKRIASFWNSFSIFPCFVFLFLYSLLLFVLISCFPAFTHVFLLLPLNLISLSLFFSITSFHSLLFFRVLFEQLTVIQQSNKFHFKIHPKGSPPYSLYLESDHSSSHLQTLLLKQDHPFYLTASAFNLSPLTILGPTRVPVTRTACSSHLFPVDLTTWTVSGDKYKSWSSYYVFFSFSAR